MTLPPLFETIGVMLVITVAACSSTASIDRGRPSSVDPFLSLLNKGITQLDININGLSKRLNDVQQIPSGTNPLLRELQALNVSGWQLHQQQWVVQRDHLVLARNLLQQAGNDHGARAELLERWRRHVQEYGKAIEDLRRQRQDLEQQHADLEARLTEQTLRGQQP
ncbi:MAG TPA: hypothetical protein VFS39_02950 [Nitrospira sp.]|nr:hypothetical protein [Nitrospira sp.]